MQKEVSGTLCVHTDIFCNLCKSEICGVRYKCVFCQSFDLCTICYNSPGASNETSHDSTHPCLAIEEHLVFYNSRPILASISQPLALQDLEINDAGLPKHPHIICDACNCDIWGVRHKCSRCDDFDLCSACFERRQVYTEPKVDGTSRFAASQRDELEDSRVHNRGGSHVFVLIPTPFPSPTHPPKKLFNYFDSKNPLVCRESFCAFDSWPCRCCASSPFGLIPVSEQIKHKSIPLKGVLVTIEILELFAKVTVEQTYVNSSFDPVEATLTLPLPGMSTMKRYIFQINGEVIAQGHGVYLMHPARNSSIHLKVKSRTRTVSMEQDTEIANVFQSNIGKLPPGKEVNISITYTTKLSIDDQKSVRIVIPKGFAPLQNQEAKVGRECEDFFEEVHNNEQKRNSIFGSGEHQQLHTHKQEGNWLGLPFTALSPFQTAPTLMIRMTASHSSGFSSVSSLSHVLTTVVLSEERKKVDAEYVGLFLRESLELRLELLAKQASTKALIDGCREITLSEWIECWNTFCSQSKRKLSDCQDSSSQGPEKIASLGSLALKSISVSNREMIDENLLASTDSSICAVSSCRKIFGTDEKGRRCAIVDCISHNSCGCIIDPCSRCAMKTCSWHAVSHSQWCTFHSTSMCGAELVHSSANHEVKNISLQGWCGRLMSEIDKGNCHYCKKMCCPLCRDTCTCGRFWCKVCVSKILVQGSLYELRACCPQVQSVIFQDQVYLEESLRRYKVDIGTFARHIHSPGYEILEGLQSIENIPNASVYSLVCNVNRNRVRNDLTRTTVLSQEVLKILNAAGCLALRTLLDRECGSAVDYKRTVSVGELAVFIGLEAVERISTFMEHDFNTIILRRCCAEGLCINFHLDHSLKTMQIALNDDNEYVGGRLVFATNDGVLYVPRRPAGSVTIHNNTVVHGVSTLRSGVRYGLFFLKTLPES